MKGLIADLEAAYGRLSIIISAFRYFFRLDLTDNFSNEVQRNLSKSEEQRAALVQALAALERLVNLGYPNFPPVRFSPELLQVFRDNIKGQQDALQNFDVVNDAVSGRFVAGKEGPIDKTVGFSAYRTT